MAFLTKKAVRASEQAGCSIERQGKPIILSNGTRTIVVPHNNLIKSFTLAGIVKSAGLSVDQSRELL